MDQTISELEQLGLDAARQAAGDEAVGAVEVAEGWDYLSDRPVYNFSFLIDQARSRQRAGLVRTRIIQKLRDGLIERKDGHFPVITILDRTDWEQRGIA